MGMLLVSSLKGFIPRKGGFAANILTLVAGTGLAQALTMGATPILTRLYGPEDFGLLALFLSVTGILSVVANWRYELAIVLPKDDREGINVLALSALIALGMSGFSVLVVAFFRNGLARLMNAPELASWLWWVPLSLLLNGIFQALSYWNTRKKQFRLQSLARVGQSVGTIGTQVGAGLAAAGGGTGLIIGTLVGQLVGTGILGERVWRQQKQLVTDSVSTKALWEQAVRYKKFPFLTNFAGLVNQIAYQIPIWLLASFYSPQMIGFYMLAQRAAYLPASLVGASISQVFFERAAQEKKETGSSIQTFKKTLLLLSMLSVVPFAVLMIWGPALFSLVFGEAWTQAGRFAAILAPLFWVSFVASPLIVVNAIHEKQEVGLIWHVSLCCLSVLVLYGGHILTNNIYTILLIFSMVLTVWYALLIVITFNISRHGRIIK